MASARPPRKGPIWRHCIALKSFSSIAPAGVGEGDGVTARETEQMKTKPAKIASAIKRKRNVDVIIRLRWESCVTVQLESRSDLQSSGWSIFNATGSGQR